MRRLYVKARSHDDKYYSRNPMRAIRVGLDRLKWKKHELQNDILRESLAFRWCSKFSPDHRLARKCTILACVASVCVGLGSKERDFWCFSRAKNGARAKKRKNRAFGSQLTTFYLIGIWQTCRSQVLRKMFENNKHNSLHLALIFFLGHYLFLEAHNFSQASLSENNSLLGTCSGQISDIISRQMEAIVYITPPKIP